MPSQLSGGQQQRVALARALAPSPGLLLLDEPLSALDAQVRARLRREIREVQSRLGVTTIMVTHDQEEAQTMADRIVVLKDGRVEQVGSPEEVYAAPATPFVADFIGVMNFAAGRIAQPGRVAVGPLAVEADTGAFAAGSAVSCAFRPEDLVVEARSASAGEARATVAEVESLGAFVRLYLRAEGIAEELRADVRKSGDGRVHPAAGDAVALRVPAGRARLYPATA